MLNSNIFKIFAYAVIFSLFIPIASSYSEELESLQLEVKYTNGDRRDAFQTNYIVYQDFSSTPFLEKKMDANPEILFLPENHRYKIEIFVDGLYSESGYVDLKSTPEKLDIHIPLPGGIQLNVFYDDGETPVNNAKVILLSKNGDQLGSANTNAEGKTLRYWLQPTLLEDDFYKLDIYVDDLLATSIKNIKIFTGTSVSQKIIIPVPEVVEELLTFRLFNTNSQMILKSDGDYSIVLADKKLNPLFTSSLKDKGEIYFSNINSGVYTVLVLNEGKREYTWNSTPIAIFGNQTKFDLYENDNFKPIQKPISIPLKDPITIPLKDPITIPLKDPTSKPKIYAPSIKQYTLSCNCISFRFDDVQDFWLNNAQSEVLKQFSENKIPLTLGVAINVFQFDDKLIDVVKSEIKKGNFEIANNGLDHLTLTESDDIEIDKILKESQNKFKKVFNVTPKLFIPPESILNDDTKQLLIDNGFTHLSSSNIYDKPPYPLQNESLYSFPRVASTAFFDPSQQRFLGIPADTTFPILLKSLKENGFAVVSIHPQEYSIFKDGENQNEIDHKQIQELKKLIDLIQAQDIEIVHISEIDQKVSKVSISSDSTSKSGDDIFPTWLKNNAGWWRDGFIDNDTFIQGIQYLINEDIVKIPPTSQGSGGSEIPNWVKNNAGWWADGQISDDDFIQGIDHLVHLGVITIGT
jgi:peptidoglycan/xylan/chitin deacetylase (PgdA/CDA1 family)